MFEYVSPKKVDKAEIKGRILTVIITLVSAGGIFAILIWAATSYE
jgi:hypothetical protein